MRPPAEAFSSAQTLQDSCQQRSLHDDVVLLSAFFLLKQLTPQLFDRLGYRARAASAIRQCRATLGDSSSEAISLQERMDEIDCAWFSASAELAEPVPVSSSWVAGHLRGLTRSRPQMPGGDLLLGSFIAASELLYVSRRVVPRDSAVEAAAAAAAAAAKEAADAHFVGARCSAGGEALLCGYYRTHQLLFATDLMAHPPAAESAPLVRTVAAALRNQTATRLLGGASGAVWDGQERDLAAEVAFTLKAVRGLGDNDDAVRALVERLRAEAAEVARAADCHQAATHLMALMPAASIAAMALGEAKG